MRKRTSKIKFILYGLTLVLFFIGFSVIAKPDNKNQVKRNNKSLFFTGNLSQNPVFNAFENDNGFFEMIALKITDGKQKYIYVTEIHLINTLGLKNCEFRKQNKRIANILKTGFLCELNFSGYFLHVPEETIKKIKKNFSPKIIPYDDYLKTEVYLNQFTLKQIISKFFIKKHGNYYLNIKKLPLKKCTPLKLIAYLYFHYNIVISCLDFGDPFIDLKINLIQKFSTVKN